MTSGIVEPPIDELLAKTKSKYILSVLAAKRARQINSYYAQLSEGLLENIGPLVESDPKENPVNIAMREIREGFVVPSQAE
ncbi:MAG: DNA-directed RNA polymerase subunit omega [Bifidobacteriaceae bacterium]|jgi:DNA-directed RNA polymerase subunit omega|nr:DNA-directed RNA polymerase subunit omega [Bifidobacteriaceae bacterium]